MFAPDRDYPLLGYPVCRVLGCGREAWEPEGLCSGCRVRFAAAGGDVELFSAQGAARKDRSRFRRCLVCRVPGFERPVGTNDLCLACDGQRRRRSGVSLRHSGARSLTDVDTGGQRDPVRWFQSGSGLMGRGGTGASTVMPM